MSVAVAVALDVLLLPALASVRFVISSMLGAVDATVMYDKSASPLAGAIALSTAFTTSSVWCRYVASRRKPSDESMFAESWFKTGLLKALSKLGRLAALPMDASSPVGGIPGVIIMVCYFNYCMKWLS